MMEVLHTDLSSLNMKVVFQALEFVIAASFDLLFQTKFLNGV